MFAGQLHKTVLFYWLSPLVIFITYWHGQTDLVPVLFFLASLWLIQGTRFREAGVCLGLSIGAKFSMAIGLPLIIVYFWQSKTLRQAMSPFLLSLVCCLAVVQLPFLLSDGYQQMVLQNREVDRLYQLSLDFGGALQVYIAPMAYLFTVYLTWRMRRMNLDMLYAVIGAGYSIIILLTPAPPGWFLWLVPFYTAHQIKTGPRAVLLLGLLSFLFIVFHGAESPGAALPLLGWDLSINHAAAFLPDRLVSLWYTMLVAVGGVVALQIMREGIGNNDYYKLYKRPLTLGIAGNSGVGKDTFAAAMSGLFGNHAVMHISGDDYHNWDRGSPMWKTTTHLNPMANQLSRFANDVRRLANGDKVQARHYNHSTGRFTPLQNNNSEYVVIASGLHTLYPKSLREIFDVRFFLDMEETLRIHLKLDRDTRERGQTHEAGLTLIEKRRPDYDRFVAPQKEFADVFFTLKTVNPTLLDDPHSTSFERNLMLIVRLRNGIYYRELVRALAGVCGLYMNVTFLDHQSEVEIEVQGDVSAEDIALATHMLLPHINDLLDVRPEWKSGMLGVMQLAALVDINEALLKREHLRSETR